MKTDGRCIYCAESLRDDWQVEHVRPVSRGGTHAPSNVWPACVACNQRKSDRSFKSWALELLREWQKRANGSLLVDLQAEVDALKVENARLVALDINASIKSAEAAAQRQVDEAKQKAQRQVDEARLHAEQRVKRARTDRDRLLLQVQSLHRTWRTAREYVVITGPIPRAQYPHTTNAGG